MNDASPRAASAAGVNPWFVAVAVVVPTFMEVLDTTIANVALRYIAGGLSASEVDSEWVITSYLAANAIVLPVSGWLSSRLGRRNYFLLSIGVFTLASGLCGICESLNALIACRVLQGLAGGGLQPSSQGVLLDAFPPEKQGAAMTVFGVAALIAPVIGPTLGGWLTDNYSWRWIFYINIPVGGIALLASYFLLHDPEYLQRERAEIKRRPFEFDSLGMSLLALVMVCWEVLLSKGQQWDWFGDPFYRVQTLATLFALGLVALVARELTARAPVVNLAPFRERNFTLACAIAFGAYMALYGTSTTLPAMLQSLFGYDATQSGLVLSPSGLFSLISLPVVGMLIGRGVDSRRLVMLGLLVLAGGCYWMSQMNLGISPGQAVWPRVLMTVGVSILFAPLSVAAYMYTPLHLRGAAVGIFSLLRNEGGSVGTSLAQTFHERRDQFHALRLGEWIDPFNANVLEYLAQAQAAFLKQTGDPVAAEEMAIESLAAIREQQGSSLAYFDVFWGFAVISLALVVLTLLMKRSVAAKGAHAAMD